MSKGGIGQNILREMNEDFHEEIPVPKIKELLNEVKTKMSKEKELTQGERYIIAQTMDDFDNTWNDNQEFDDMDLPRLRSELTERQLKLLNQKKDDYV